MSLRQLGLTHSWESGSPFSWSRALESKASYLAPTHSFIHQLTHSLIHSSIHALTHPLICPLIHPSTHPSNPLFTNICDGLGIVAGMEDTSLALLHFSHELLQTPVLLQGICHLLGSHWPDAVLLQAVGEGSFSKAGHNHSQAKDSLVQGERSETTQVPSLFIAAWGEGSPGKVCGLLPKCC